MNDQEILMGKTKDAVRHDRFTVSDNYLKGCDYPYGGGYMVSCEGTQFGSLRFQGGGVIFTADAAGCYITDAEEIPILANRVHFAWTFLMEEGEGYSVEGWEASGGWVDPNEPMSEEEECGSCGGVVEIEGNSTCITCDYEKRMAEEASDDEPEWDRKYDKGGASL